MIQEDKNILLKYLCMALPYRVKISKVIDEYISESTLIKSLYTDGSIVIENEPFDDGLPDVDAWDICEIKPYLRPMSSMTDEECKELGELPATINNIGETFPNTPYYIEVARVEQINWLLEHHFDFMGLIPKGLAVEVTESNNPYKE